MRRLIIALLAGALLAGCGSYQYRATAIIEQPAAAKDFTLTDQEGRPFHLAEQRGRLLLVFFGYTNCPDVCPTALADLAAVRRQLGPDGERVRLVFVTVDPERDTAERMARYARAFDPTIVALRGTDAELAAVYADYGVVAQRRELPNTALRYTMDHTSAVYVIDQYGRWRGLIGHGAPVADMTADVRQLLASAQPLGG